MNSETSTSNCFLGFLFVYLEHQVLAFILATLEAAIFDLKRN